MDREVEDLSARSIDELLELVGRDLVGRQAMPLPKSQVIDRARRWLLHKLDVLRPTVCGGVVVKGVIESSDGVALVTAVADVIAAHVVGVSPVTVAAILVKVGLKRLCAGVPVDL